MHKKIIYGAMCVAFSAMLIGCNNNSKDTNESNPTTTQSSDTTETPVPSDSGETPQAKSDDSKDAWILRKEMSTEPVLAAPADAYLFADNLALPIKIDDLMEHQVEDSELGIGSLASIIEKDTETYNTQTYYVFNKDGTEEFWMPELTFGSKDSDKKTTVKQAIADGKWMLGPSTFIYEMLGMTQEEYETWMIDHPDDDPDYMIMDKLFERLGTPNYIGWTDDTYQYTKEGSYDAKEFVTAIRNPQDKEDGSILYRAHVGWQFADYGIVLTVRERTAIKNGVATVEDPSADICYIPSSYGTIEDVYGSNAIKDFLSAK